MLSPIIVALSMTSLEMCIAYNHDENFFVNQDFNYL